MTAIKQADPGAVIVLPYAISPPGNSGYVWNDAVLPALANYYQGIDIIWCTVVQPIVQAPDPTIRVPVGDPALRRGDQGRHHAVRAWQVLDDRGDQLV